LKIENPFRKKSEEELFERAVVKRDYAEIVSLGEKLLNRYPGDVSILNFYTHALAKVGEKKKAAQLLFDFAERKLIEGYVDTAILFLKKVLKLDPSNVRARKLLASAYKRKELYYEAFKVLMEALKRGEGDSSFEDLEELLESLIKEMFHPSLYKEYADYLLEKGDREKALFYYLLAVNLFVKNGQYDEALRTLLKAKGIKAEEDENIDRQMVEVLTHLDEETVMSVLGNLLGSKDVEFMQFVVKIFKESGKLELLRKLISRLTIPKVKYALLALLDYEVGEVEEAEELLEKLRLIDAKTYEEVLNAIRGEHPELFVRRELLREPVSQKLPDPEKLERALESIFISEE